MDKKEYHKLYRLNHPDAFKQYRQNWDDKHPTYYRDRWAKKKEEGYENPRVQCEKCGRIGYLNNIGRHQQSKRCIAISKGLKGYSKYDKVISVPPEEQKEDLEEQVDALILP